MGTRVTRSGRVVAVPNYNPRCPASGKVVTLKDERSRNHVCHSCGAYVSWEWNPNRDRHEWVSHNKGVDTMLPPEIMLPELGDEPPFGGL